MIDCHDTAWKVPKYGLISGSTYFPVFGLNTEIYDKSPCLDTFHPVWLFYNSQNCKQIKKFWSSSQRLPSSQYYKTSHFLLVHWVSCFKILKENITDLFFFPFNLCSGFPLLLVCSECYNKWNHYADFNPVSFRVLEDFRKHANHLVP